MNLIGFSRLSEDRGEMDKIKYWEVSWGKVGRRGGKGGTNFFERSCEVVGRVNKVFA